MIFNLKKIALIQKNDPNNGNDDTVVILTNINEGVDGSSVFGFTKEHSSLIISNNQSYINSVNSTLDIRVLKSTGNAYSGKSNLDQIKDWADNLTSLYISAVTVDGAFFFGDRVGQEGLVKIAINEQLSSDDILALKVTKNSEVGFNTSTGLHESGLWAGSNLIGGYEWADKDSSGFADGWIDNGSWDSSSFTSGQQSLTANTSTANLQRTFYFPFDGEELTFSFNVDSFGTDYTNVKMGMQFFDKAGVSSGAGTLTTISGTGLVSNNKIVPLNTVYVLALIVVQSSSTSTTIISDPVIRLGSSTTYTKF